MGKRPTKSRTKRSETKSAGKSGAPKRARTRSPRQRGPAAGERKEHGEALARPAPSPAAAPACEKNKGGRPPVSPELLERVLDRVAGGEYLEDVCRDPDMPSSSSVRKYKRQNEKFAAAYARAREDQMEAFEYQAHCIATDGSSDFKKIKNQDGTERLVADHENIQRSKLRVENLRWTMSKLFPALYGERLALDVNDATPLASALNRAKERARAAGYALPESDDGRPETTH